MKCQIQMLTAANANECDDFSGVITHFVDESILERVWHVHSRYIHFETGNKNNLGNNTEARKYQ
jgi:hypothetical protein